MVGSQKIIKELRFHDFQFIDILRFSIWSIVPNTEGKANYFGLQICKKKKCKKAKKKVATKKIAYL